MSAKLRIHNMDMLLIVSNRIPSIILNKRNMFIRTKVSLPVAGQMRWGGLPRSYLKHLDTKSAKEVHCNKIFLSSSESQATAVMLADARPVTENLSSF
jgi:hypothetical protein